MFQDDYTSIECARSLVLLRRCDRSRRLISPLITSFKTSAALLREADIIVERTKFDGSRLQRILFYPHSSHPFHFFFLWRYKFKWLHWNVIIREVVFRCTQSTDKRRLFFFRKEEINACIERLERKISSTSYFSNISTYKGELYLFFIRGETRWPINYIVRNETRYSFEISMNFISRKWKLRLLFTKFSR